MRVLVYSFDIMLEENKDQKFFATLTYRIRKNLISNSFVVNYEDIRSYILSRYPSLKKKRWHIECNENGTFISNCSEPTVIKEKIKNPFRY